MPPGMQIIRLLVQHGIGGLLLEEISRKEQVSILTVPKTVGKIRRRYGDYIPEMLNLGAHT